MRLGGVLSMLDQALLLLMLHAGPAKLARIEYIDIDIDINAIALTSFHMKLRYCPWPCTDLYRSR